MKKTHTCLRHFLFFLCLGFSLLTVFGVMAVRTEKKRSPPTDAYVYIRIENLPLPLAEAVTDTVYAVEGKGAYACREVPQCVPTKKYAVNESGDVVSYPSSQERDVSLILSVSGYTDTNGFYTKERVRLLPGMRISLSSDTVMVKGTVTKVALQSSPNVG